jgi:hypothetical protein
VNKELTESAGVFDVAELDLSVYEYFRNKAVFAKDKLRFSYVFVFQFSFSDYFFPTTMP